MKSPIIVLALVFLLASTGCGGIIAGDREQASHYLTWGQTEGREI